MGSNRFFKVFIVLFLSTAFIFGFSHFGVLALEDGFRHVDQFSNGTSAGGVDLSGVEKDKAQQKLIEAVQKWKASGPVTIHYLNHSIKLPAGQLQFDIAESLNRVQNGKSTQLAVTLNNRALMKLISASFPEISLEDWNIDQLNAAICKAAAKLKTGDHVFDLASYAIVDHTEKTVSKATLTSIPMAYRYELETWAKEFPKLEIPAQTSFSVLKTAGKTGSSFSNEALSMVATAIYEAVLPTNFEMIERSISNELPSYALPGKEARVEKDKLDLTFINPNPSAYILHCTYRNAQFTVSVSGRPFAEKYKITAEDAQTIEPKTAVHYTDTLSAKQMVVLQYGKAGHYVKIYRNVYSQENSLLKSVLISEDFYPAVSKIVSKGYPQESTQETTSQTGSTGSADSNPDTASSGDQSEPTDKNKNTGSSEKSGDTSGEKSSSSHSKETDHSSKISKENSAGSTNSRS